MIELRSKHASRDCISSLYRPGLSKIRFVMVVIAAISCLSSHRATAAAHKPLLTLDAFFNFVEFRAVRISPNGREVVIETRRADWTHNRYRNDLWLDRAGPGGARRLIPLSTNGYEHDPRWSPDGRWIAFLSNRPQRSTTSAEARCHSHPIQLEVIRADGGAPIQLTEGRESVHAFCWAADSKSLYFATRRPETDAEREAYRKEWHDVVQWREQERGDAIFSVSLTGAAGYSPNGLHSMAPRFVSMIRYRVWTMSAAPNGQSLGIATRPRSMRMESLNAYSLYLADLPSGRIRLLTHRLCRIEQIHWASDSRHIFFWLEDGAVRGPYHDAQQRVYWVNAATGKITRWGAHFFGSINGYSPGDNNSLAATGRLGTQVQIYTQQNPASSFVKRTIWPGTFRDVSAARSSQGIAFVYSALRRPAEVYYAPSVAALSDAKPITSFNQGFNQFALPRGRTFHWKTDDGLTEEGMLIYPPGQFGAKHLSMFTLIHGGPEEASGDEFEFNWYKYGALAASNGWLVFEPNYRGSTGYGDAFTLAIAQQIVSRPSKDILEGVDALVSQGIADPNHLTVGGYSYGGYLTDWIITQTTRFRAAVTGAGAIENAVNWGNDDLSFDDAYFLGGLPWTAEKTYNAEAALWRLNRVKTPTHIVAGADDIRVYVGEDYLLERALHTLGVPETMLIFPGEGHMLTANPWHGKIKVREELKWIRKYGFGP